MMTKVAVILSTFNGEAYIKEQIDSILSQTGVELTLFIRDDGSSDSTKSILDDYCISHENIFLFDGENLGVGNSFMQLLYKIPHEFDYYAFSDQDDVWMEKKLQTAIEALSSLQGPKLYCSNQLLIDKNGNQIGLRHNGTINTSYLQIMCDNLISGCTMVWNQELQRILADPNRRPSPFLLRNRIHDVWVSMVASVVGSIYYDENPYILYRQHDNNVVGVDREPLIKVWLRKIKNPGLRKGRSLLATEVLNCYSDLIRDNSIKENLHVFSSYYSDITNKINMIRNTEIPALTKEIRILYISKVLLNLF